MACIDNRTGVPHCWLEQTGPDGQRIDVLIVRATFDFAAHGKPLTLARIQRPIAFGDTFAGPVETDPMRALVQDDGDLLPYKPGTDIVVSGHAHAPDGCARTDWVAGVRVGQVKKILRLHGPRQFRKKLFGWGIGPSEPVVRIALDYRLAYGGCIDVPAMLNADGQPDAIKHPGNPVGCGWLPLPSDYQHLSKPARAHVARWISDQKVLPAPQIEAASEPLKHPYHHLAAQGLGAVARWWAPRLAYQGSYDEHWRNTRYPLLPEKFDSRYYQSAPPDLVATPHLSGDESITLAGLLPGKRDMRLPGWRLIAVVKRASGESSVSLPLLDTVRFDLDLGQASLVWRAHFDDDDPVTDITLAATTAAIESEQSASSTPRPASEVGR